MIGEELTEAEAYKHLLEVAENIIESMDPDREIMAKYEALKKAVKSKIRFEKTQKQTVEAVCHTVYKGMVEQIVTCLTSFQAEMENKAEASLQQSLFRFKQQFNRDVDELNSLILPKKKQVIREQINTCQNMYKQLCSKFENLQLLLQIHGKMHEIIEQATGRQISRQEKQNRNSKRVQELEEQITHIKDAQQFLKRYQLTSATRQQLKVLQKELRNILQ